MATIGIVILLLPALLRGGISPGDLVPLGVIALITVLGFVSWFVTRWTIDGDDLRIETGVLVDAARSGSRCRRCRRSTSCARGWDGCWAPPSCGCGWVVRPATPPGSRTWRPARSSSSATSSWRSRTARRRTNPATTAAVAADEHVLTTVPTARLVASILISDVGFYAEAVLAALVVTALLAPAVASAVISGGGLVWLLGVITVTWRRFNQEYRLTVADAPDGLRLSGGLVSLTSETIRRGRVQAVRMTEPLLWRPFGWCRLQVGHQAGGRQPSDGDGTSSGASSASCFRLAAGRWSSRCSTGSSPIAQRQSPPPRRVRFKSPLRYRMLAWGGTDTCVVTTSGRLRRTTCWVPLEKVQSLRRDPGAGAAAAEPSPPCTSIRPEGLCAPRCATATPQRPIRP